MEKGNVIRNYSWLKPSTVTLTATRVKLTMMEETQRRRDEDRRLRWKELGDCGGRSSEELGDGGGRSSMTAVEEAPRRRNRKRKDEYCQRNLMDVLLSRSGNQNAYDRKKKVRRFEMSISPYETGQFRRQQGVLDSMWAAGHPLSQGMMQRRWGMPSVNRRMDYEETPESHLFRVRLQGNEEDVRVRVEDGRVLHVSTRGAEERNEGSPGGFYRVERSCGEFVSKFKLPEDADVDRVTSSVNGGTLTVVAPRRRSSRLNAPATRDCF
ncbi:hypothetical protein V2J09_017644 [Rumex salicifolius]